ncbi:hypothetical protein [Ferruginibacter sp.]|uniref:hypothetical protein n=1 Tax=Ferruginibacter sp. TaxID=1940288 RepID=UPI001996E17C|nr:hypothetical protein [Ferruginibacter sp.]MBC7626487.1 hypothetical protein [Ferruginibacter sp.]
MKKLPLLSFFLFLLLMPVLLPAQDITGLWKGEMYVDSTKQHLPFELSISEVKGKLVGYSHITFEENGKIETGLRDVTIRQKDKEVIIEDVSLLDNSFSFTPPKNIKKIMEVTLTIQDSTMQLKGSWSTNRTKRFLSATGTVQMQRKNDFKTTVLYKKLQDLKLADQLVFNEPQKKPVPEVAELQLPVLENAGTPPVLLNPDVAQKPEKVHIKIKAPVPPPVLAIATVAKPVETKPLQPAVVIVSKPVEAKKAIIKPVLFKPTSPPVVVAIKPVEVKKLPIVITKPAAVMPAPAIIAKPKDIVVATIEKKPVPVALPGTVQGAADVDKRGIASTQSVFFQSDSLVLTLYDNGYVDGDTVSVVMNGDVIFSKQGLSTKAVSKTIYITKDTPDSIKLVMYAENLGSIPPNTGLLVVHDGEAVYDVRFSADLQTNAAIILRRKKK